MAEIQFKYKGYKICMNIEMMDILWFSVWMTIWLINTIQEEADSICYAAEFSAKVYEYEIHLLERMHARMLDGK